MGEKYKDLMAGGVITAAFLIAHFFGLTGVTLQFILFFAVFFPAHALGRRLFRYAGTLTASVLGASVFLAIFSLLETAAFYLGLRLGTQTDFYALLGGMVVSYAGLIVINEPEAEKAPAHERLNLSWSGKIFLALAIAGLLGAATFAIHAAVLAATTDSIRTPWPLLPPGMLLALSALWLGTLLILRLSGKTWLGYAASGLAFFSTLSLTPLIYKIGFGFDGFLHVAAEKILLTTGFLSPKPLYYMGQYVFTNWLARVLDLPVENIDRWLVPLAAACLIPLALYAVRRAFGGHYAAALLFLLPLSALVATTPQSFAYVLGLTALILCLGVNEKNIHPAAPLALALWSAAAHPLAGIPLFFVCAAVLLARLKSKLALVLGYFSALLSALAVPLMFYVLGLRGGTPIHWNFSKLFAAQPWLDFFGAFNPYLSNHFALWAGWANAVALALPALLLLAAVIQIVRCKDASRHTALILASAAVALYLSAALLKNLGEFSFLIDYERGNYADRLAILGSLILALAAWPLISDLIDRALEATPLPSAAFLALFLSVAAAASYLALPRHDALTVGRGWSTGLTDIEAVRSIERDAEGAPYTVLADQSVSAAAVRELGFKRYAGDVFFYPIPTGGALYEIFLGMTYNDPSRDLAAEAGALGQSKIVYVVLNDYWWKAESTAEALSALADDEWSLGATDQGLGHSAKIYKFDLSKPSKRAANSAGS
ncbi:MAG: hypothetical protein WC641_07190 [Patescibacteria group bacterium]